MLLIMCMQESSALDCKWLDLGDRIAFDLSLGCCINLHIYGCHPVVQYAGHFLLVLLSDTHAACFCRQSKHFVRSGHSDDGLQQWSLRYLDTIARSKLEFTVTTSHAVLPAAPVQFM